MCCMKKKSALQCKKKIFNKFNLQKLCPQVYTNWPTTISWWMTWCIIEIEVENYAVEKKCQENETWLKAKQYHFPAYIFILYHLNVCNHRFWWCQYDSTVCSSYGYVAIRCFLWENNFLYIYISLNCFCMCFTFTYFKSESWKTC